MFYRATLGTTSTDKNFAANWANGKTAGVHRFAYHELTNLSPVLTQASHFISVVRKAGVLPGDGMAVVASDYPVTGAAVAGFARKVRAAFPDSPVLVYSDYERLPSLSACTEFPLWLAWYNATPPSSVAPWKDWTFWQWTDGGGSLDKDAFNGTSADLQAWLDTFVPSTSWTFGKVRNLSVRPGKTSVAISFDAPSVFEGTPPSPAPAIAQYEVAVSKGGSLTTEIPSYPRFIPKTDNPETWQGGSLAENTEYTLGVRAMLADGSHSSPWATATFRTT